MKMMKRKTTWILVAFVTIVNFANAQDPTQWNDAWGPNFRHINAVEILPDGKFVIAGGWEMDDAISTIAVSSDTGATWNIAMDNVNAWLQDLDFTSPTNGYSVGWAGNIWKTGDAGDSWTQITVPGGPGSRNYNGCYFFNDNTGVIVGGWESNDAIQTIIKTTDGGANWSIISDGLDPWLRAVHFADNTTGYAVGDAGTILKSVDAGDSWSQLTLSGSVSSRRYNDVYFIDDMTGVAVGGWPTNDSIQTIIRTTDGGANWSVISDNLGSMLNGVQFYNSTEGYAVGNDGVVLFSNDAGATWSEQIIPNNSTWGIRDVFFKDAFLGLTGGDEGKLLWYVDGNTALAEGTLFSPVTVLNANSVQIDGEVDDFGMAATIEFEYGTTMSFGTTVSMNPSSTGGTGMEPVTVELNGLTPDQIYFGRMKMTNAIGVSFSNMVTFYTGITAVPNFNFEIWDEFSNDIIDNWVSSNGVTQVASYDGSFATRLSQAPSGNELGAIIHGAANDEGLGGGIPYVERPDSISFWCNYDIAANDSALVVLQLKNNSVPIADSIYRIGGTSTAWENHRYEINYTSGITPDSIILAFANTDVFNGNGDPNSVFTIDNVELFGNATQQVPNNQMENWSTDVRHKASSWVSNDDQQLSAPYVVERSSDSYSGDYAIQFSNRLGEENDEFARIQTGDDIYDWGPSFDVDRGFERLYGYFKFSPDSGDSLLIQVNMFEAGIQIGSGQFEFGQAQLTYELFEVPINYWAGNNADSCMIHFSIYNGDGSPPGNSIAIVDNLSFESVVLPTSIVELEEEVNKVVLYPNPTEGNVTIEFDEIPEGQLYVMVVDLMGRVISKEKMILNSKQLSLNLDGLVPQYYYIVVGNGAKIHTFKTLKR